MVTRHPPAPAGGFQIIRTRSPESPSRQRGGDAVHTVRWWSIRAMVTRHPPAPAGGFQIIRTRSPTPPRRRSRVGGAAPHAGTSRMQSAAG
jgi:hypothetical protein